MVWAAVPSGHNVHDRLIGRIGNEKRFVLLDVDRVALFQDFLSTVSVNRQRSAYRAEDLFMTLARFHQSLPFTGLENAVDHVTRVRVQVFEAEDVLSTFAPREFLQVER